MNGCEEQVLVTQAVKRLYP